MWLESPELAIERVKHRLRSSGHSIPEEVIRRRYRSGSHNFFRLYREKVDNWLLVNNSGDQYLVIAEEEQLLHQVIVTGLEETYCKLVKQSRQTNTSLVVIRDGKIVQVDPFEMQDTLKHKRGGE